jgi:hypothetical protein
MHRHKKGLLCRIKGVELNRCAEGQRVQPEVLLGRVGRAMG